MANGKYIEVDPGVELFVQDVGSGDPLVLIPGWVFSSRAFESQIEHFSKTHRVIAVDPRSQGRSLVSMQGNDYVTHGKDLSRIIEALGLKDVTLLGWSFGCLTVWEYVRQNGVGNLKAAVIVDLSPKPLSLDDENDWVEGPLEEIAEVYTSNLRSPEGLRDFITEYATEIMVQRKLDDDELQWINGEAMQTPYYIASTLYAAGMFSDYREEAKRLIEQVPTLTIAAEHWGDTARSFMQRISPEAQVEVLGGHLMFWEHSGKFNKILERFLKSDA